MSPKFIVDINFCLLMVCRGTNIHAMNRHKINTVLSSYFKIQELVCPHVYQKWTDASWQFIDTAYLETLLVIRKDQS